MREIPVKLDLRLVAVMPCLALFLTACGGGGGGSGSQVNNVNYSNPLFTAEFAADEEVAQIREEAAARLRELTNSKAR